MDEQEVLYILNKTKAVITGSHVVYTSGRHGSTYVDKDAIYPHTMETSRLCRALAERFADDRVETVIAPVIGGVILSQWVAYHLTGLYGREVFSVYARKPESGNALIIRHSHEKFVTGKNVLVVDDILTTGGSVRKVIEATRAIGGRIIGLSVFCNRGGITHQDLEHIPKFTALTRVALDTWDEAYCPLCEQNIPINVNVGKGRAFLARRDD